MMKMKRFFTFTLALVLLCGMLAGCASDPAANTQAPSGNSSEPSQSQAPAGPVTRYLPVEVVRYDSKGELWYKRICTYDEKGRLLSYTFHDIEDGTGTYTYTYTYNDRGHLTSYTYQDAAFPAATVTYTYTYNNDGTVASWQAGDGGSDSYTFTYDDQGRVLSRIEVGEGGAQYSAQTCSYDSQGRLTGISGAALPLGAITYDEKGHLSGADGSIYRYDETGKRIEELHDISTYGWCYEYTGELLTGVTFSTQFDYDETRAREYVLNPDGSVASIQWANGGRSEYRYESVTLTAQEAAAIVPAWNAVNEPLTLADYISNPLAYLLPHPNFEMGDLY